MNWFSIIVLILVAACAINGFKKGFLRVVFSLVSVIVATILVSLATPYISNYLQEHTKLDSWIQEQSQSYIEEKAHNKIADSQQEAVKNSGLELPEAMQQKLVSGVTDETSQLLDQSGVYEGVAKSVSHLVLNGFSFFLAIFLVGILLRIIQRMLDLFNQVPVLGLMNRMLGMAAGLVLALIVLWLFFYLVAVCSTTSLGVGTLNYIKENQVMKYLYYHNQLISFLMMV